MNAYLQVDVVIEEPLNIDVEVGNTLNFNVENKADETEKISENLPDLVAHWLANGANE